MLESVVESGRVHDEGGADPGQWSALGTRYLRYAYVIHTTTLSREYT
jgi:hypothetical protein